MYPMLFSRQDNKRKEQTQNMLYLDITKAVYAILNSFWIFHREYCICNFVVQPCVE